MINNNGIYLTDQQDPHKEWVRIKHGCLMPNNGEEIVVFECGHQRGAMYKNGIFFLEQFDVEDMDFYFTFEADAVTHWRYHFPDPEV